jgi:glycosyltransferase involved in cell wall biosynthesis
MLRKESHKIPLAKEIILVDDASTDGTRELILNLPGQTDIIKNVGMHLTPVSTICSILDYGGLP